MNDRLHRLRTHRTPLAALLATAVTAPLANAQQDGAPVEISDEAIEIAIRSDFRHDGAVPDYRLDVDAEDGVVTLSGEVDDLLARERARELCERIRGVRAVVVGVEVDPRFPRTDREVERALENALLRDPATESYEIHTEVVDGEARLTGTVDSRAERFLAVEVAKSVHGVREIADRIEVRVPKLRSADEIRSDVERRLEAEVWVDAGPIDVEVDGAGHVTLSGDVGSAYEKRRAEWLAWVAGAQSVDTSQLDVTWLARDWLDRRRPQQPMSDDEIRDTLLAAFEADPRLPDAMPRVEVDNGTVTLDGTVDNAIARRAAEEDAKHIAGVWRVRNYVRVRPPHVVEDREIARTVEASLRDTTAVDADEVRVEVDHGLVYLQGSVDSDWERTRAGHAARTADGVLAVTNLLLVEHPHATYAEGELADECERRMKWSPYLDASNIGIRVSGRTLTLTGSVPTWRQRLEAARCAHLAGAETVVNLLRLTEDDSGS